VWLAHTGGRSWGVLCFVVAGAALLGTYACEHKPRHACGRIRCAQNYTHGCPVLSSFQWRLLLCCGFPTGCVIFVCRVMLLL